MNENQNVIVEQKSSVKLIRGQRGNYGWEIKVVSDNPDELVQKAAELDAQLKRIYPNEIKSKKEVPENDN